MSKNNVTKPDELQEVNQALGKAEAFIETNLTKIIAGVLVVIVVALGVVLFRTKYVAPRELKAQEQIFRGENYFAVDSFRVAIYGDNEGYIGFKKIIDEYGITKTANLAKAYTGISYFKLGDFKNATVFLDKFKADDKMVSPAVIGLIGDCYVEMGDKNKAISLFLKAANKADNDVVSPLYLRKAGTAYESQSNYAKAIEVYTTIQDKYPNSPIANEMEQRIGRATVLSTQQ